MYYKTNVAGFAEAIGEICNKGTTCSAVFLSDEGGWGKLFVRSGEICSLRYNASKGMTALAELANLTNLQYQFRSEEKAVISDKACNLDNESFFEAFASDMSWEAIPKFSRGSEKDSPKKTIQEKPEKKATPAISPSYQKKKILIADDSRVARKVVAKVLIEAGFSVIEAENGFEALGQLQNETPDLILLDLIMPGIDGYKLANYLKKREQFCNIPLFILTSRDSLLDKIKGQMKSECDEYMTKPLDGPLLLKKINHYLGTAKK